VEADSIYKAHRIHTTPLSSGRWISVIVNMGQMKAATKHSLTPTVTRVPDEYDSKADTLKAATQYIDDECSR
jgi:hypothetical protein